MVMLIKNTIHLEWEEKYHTIRGTKIHTSFTITLLTLTHRGRTHISISKINITGSDNGLSPGRRQAIVWTNAGILLIGPLGTNFSEILIEIYTFLFKKMQLKMSSAKWRPFCLSLTVLMVRDCSMAMPHWSVNSTSKQSGTLMQTLT